MVYCIFLYGFRSKYMDPGGAKAEDALEDQLIRGASERDRKLYIPIIGINGAAIASVAAQLFVNFALCFIVPSLRPVGRMILEGIDPRQLRRLWSGHLSNPFRKK